MAFWNRKKKKDDGEYITVKVKKRDLLPPHYVELYEKLWGPFDAEEFLREACNYGIAVYPREVSADLRFHGQGRPFPRLLEKQRAATALPQRETPTEQPRRSDDEDTLAALGLVDNPLPLSAGIPRAVRKIPAGMVRIYIYAETRYISIPAALGRRITREGWKCWCPIFNEKEHKFFIAFAKDFSPVGRRVEHNGQASLRLRCTAAEVSHIEKCLNVRFQEQGNNLVSHTPPQIDGRGLLRIYLYK